MPVNVSAYAGIVSALLTGGTLTSIPEPYSGEADLEKFEMFIAGVLQWLSMSMPLTPDTTMLQVKYVGMHLADDTQEWYIRNVEHHGHTVREWTWSPSCEQCRNNSCIR